MSCPCCQLHLHSRYSFKDGLNLPSELVQKAAFINLVTDGGMPGIGLTDHGVLYAAPDFFKACKEHGMKGVIGMEAYEAAVPWDFDLERDGEIFKVKWADLGDRDRYYHLTLWAKNDVGWRNLVALNNIAWSASHHPSVRGKPLVDRAMLERHREGLMVGMGCMASRANVWIARNEIDRATEAAKWYAERWEGDFVVEVMGNLPEQVALQHVQRKIARTVGADVLATNDVHYLDQANGVEDGPHHVYVQSRRFKKADTEESTDRSDDGFGSWYGSDEFYLKDGAQMLQTAGLQRAEIELSVALLDRVTFDFDTVPKPSPPTPLIPAPGDDPEFDAWIARHGAEIQVGT